MMIINCFCGMVDRRKTFSRISSRDHSQISSLLQILNTREARFEPAQNLSSEFFWKSCAYRQPLHHGANSNRILFHISFYFLIYAHVRYVKCLFTWLFNLNQNSFFWVDNIFWRALAKFIHISCGKYMINSMLKNRIQKS